jgi:hypothetical protein
VIAFRALYLIGILQKPSYQPNSDHFPSLRNCLQIIFAEANLLEIVRHGLTPHGLTPRSLTPAPPTPQSVCSAFCSPCCCSASLNCRTEPLPPDPLPRPGTLAFTIPAPHPSSPGLLSPPRRFHAFELHPLDKECASRCWLGFWDSASVH